jgi:peroxiredoxin
MKWRSLDESATQLDLRSLREQFAERKQLIAKYALPETQAIHARAIVEIRDGGIVRRALAVGSLAPPFELQDQNGVSVSSTEVLKKASLVICFFRGRWCPFCVGQLEAMNLLLPQIQEAGVTLFGISPQTVQQSFFMVDQHKLRFPLLSDRNNETARKFGLVYHVPDYQQSVYRRSFVNLPHLNGDDSWELPVPATYIVGRDGIVRYASVNPDYSERPEPADILENLPRV